MPLMSKGIYILFAKIKCVQIRQREMKRVLFGFGMTGTKTPPDLAPS